MTSHPDELDWLFTQRPEIAPPDPTTTAHARSALLSRGTRSRRRRQAVTSTVAASAVLGAAVVIGVTAPHHRRGEHVRAVPGRTFAAVPTTGGRGQLIELAADVKALPASAGDATLVYRDATSTGGTAVSGYDLYLDDGSYYFADSLAGLQSAVNDRQAQSAGVDAHFLDDLASASTDSPAQARALIWNDSKPTIGPAIYRSPSHPAALTEAQAEDNYVWMFATLALESDAGRPDVRVTAMNAISTLPDVEVSSARIDGRPVTRVTNTEFGDDDVLDLDATSGIPLRATNMAAGGPTFTTNYDIERVTAAHLPTQLTGSDSSAS